MSLFSLFQMLMNHIDWMFSLSMILFTVLIAFEFFCMIVNAPVISKVVRPCTVTQTITYWSCFAFANLLVKWCGVKTFRNTAYFRFRDFIRVRKQNDKVKWH